MCHFSLATFDVCSSSLTFNIVTVMLPSLSFILFIIIDVCFASWIWKFLVKFGEIVAFYLKFFSTFFLSFLCDIPFTHLCNDHVCIQYPVIFCCHLTSPQDSVFYFCIFCLVFTSVLSINLKNLFLFIMSFQFYCTITYL